MSDKKQMMDIKAVKSVSVAVSDDTSATGVTNFSNESPKTPTTTMTAHAPD